MNKQTWIQGGRWALAGLLAVASCVALFYAVERYRGAKEWREAKEELEGRGEIVDYQALIPPPVPDELNVAAIPLFQNLDWEGTGKKTEAPWKMPSREGGPARPAWPALYGQEPYDLKPWRAYFLHALDEKDPGPQVSDGEMVLKGLRPMGPLLDEVQKAMQERPLVRWPIRYEKLWQAGIPQANVVLDLGKAYCLRALAQGRLGKADRALEDLKSHFRLAEAVGGDGFLIGALVEMSMDSLGAGVVKQLLAETPLSPKQLEELQELLARQNAVQALGNGIRWERAGFCAMALKLKAEDFTLFQSIANTSSASASPTWELWTAQTIFRFYPRGWIDADRALCATAIQSGLLDHLDVSRRYVDLQAIRENEQQIMTRVKSKALPKHLLFAMAFPAVSSASRKAGEVQAWLALGAMGCALERHRLQKGGYPESLEALRPEFAASLPLDPFTGENLHYQPDADGKGFRLHSVGLNLRDDGGVPADRKTKEQEGDWVLRIRR